MADVGFDMDDVLSEWQKPFSRWHNNHYGTHLRYEDFYTFDYTQTLGVPTEKVVERVLAFQKSEDFKNVLPWKGAVLYVDLLAQRHNLHVVTSRGESMEELTRTWLDKYYPDCFQEIHFTNHHSDWPKKTKSAVCKENGLQILVDDNADFAFEAAENGIYVVVPKRPWNNGLKHERIKPVGAEWHNVYSAVEDLAQQLDR